MLGWATALFSELLIFQLFSDESLILGGPFHEMGHPTILGLLDFFFFCLFAISWAAPVAYRGSQARGRIRAVATDLGQSHKNSGSEFICTLHHSSLAMLKP